MLIALDLDGTVWDHHDISSLYPPFKRVSPLKIQDSRGAEVTLRKHVRDFLQWARNSGHIITTLSWNDFQVAYQALRAFEIDAYFHYLVIEPHPRKDKMLYYLLRRIKAERGVEIKPQDIVYIDDRDIHIREIWENIGPVRFIQFGIDVKCFLEIIPLLSA
ncbi:magnesium-dependent phosphatase-1 [Pyrobaculum aerophilum]|uniref:Magnesium-dependent phosphatase-1 n=1 Tax=Pyrobaculum aerophilum TaxID=13773 RepID=A0A371R423_9CREN|nr:magnesium-dependent phosphatase-1 [Pyrobaculum aerophilum]RFA98515.1 magnesium-dependent phosphatase-1 [Pyrobaculum aerophilum]RFB00016.1 magnesium-dependent phosphatase-1 [Pyrobaculum aerophilum]